MQGIGLPLIGFLFRIDCCTIKGGSQVTSCLDSSCRPESNKLGFARFGARMRKLWLFQWRAVVPLDLAVVPLELAVVPLAQAVVPLAGGSTAPGQR